ncbi:hypothetical protein ACIBI8_37375 [Streptomyces sp. NPDC050529]|uniref:hypothetical protein n=1 Tax=Streptomyces sp. NPDC050529 TaxID=3365624 RepID=UPI0037B6307F
MVRADQGDMTVWSADEVRHALDAYRAEVLAEGAAELRARAKQYTGEFADSDILHEDGPSAAVATWKRAAERLLYLAACGIRTP